MSRRWDSKSPGEQRRRLYERDGGVCQKCFNPIPFNKATRGHIIPRFLRGPKTDDNMRLECSKCNNSERFGELTYNVLTEEQLLVHEMTLMFLRIREYPSKAAQFLRDEERYEEIPQFIRQVRTKLLLDFERRLNLMPWIALDRQHGVW